MKARAARIIEVFNEAKALPPGSEREQWLSDACGNDELLRADVNSLLEADSSAEAFLEVPSGSPSGAVKTEGPGDRVGRYQLLEKIGEGGCGIVYLAEQEQPVRRRVALKIIKLGMDTRQAVTRFEAERQALALMDHPNIAKVFDGGATDLGRPYFVMELVRGIKVTDYCDQHSVPTEQRLALFIQVCQAVQHAHQKGVIHRDLKPSNILVTVDDDGAPVPKVIDFGIAKATEQRLTEHTALTALEQFIGTPAYMSPEQAAMSSLDIDTRTDVYSLGVVLYELLTGCTPFDSGTLAQSGVEEIRRIIREKEPPRPSARFQALAPETVSTVAALRRVEPAKLFHRIRGDLDWIVMKCLEKDRSRRYETANGLVADLQRHCRNEPVSARPPSHAYRFQKMVRRNKLTVAATAAVAVALLAGLGAATWMFFKERHARQRAESAEQAQNESRLRAEAEAARSTQVAQFMKEMLQGVGPGVARGKDTALLREILAQTAQRLKGELHDQPKVKADLSSTLASIYFDLGDYAHAEEMHEEAVALWQKVHGRNHPSVAFSLTGLGQVLHLQDQDERSEAAYREALEILKRHADAKETGVATILVHLGTLMRKRGDPEQAEILLEQALAIRKRVMGPESAPVAEALNNLGRLLHSQPGRAAEAEPLFRQALEIRRKVLGNDHFLVAATLSQLGRTLETLGKLPESEALAREAFDVASKILDGDHPDLVIFMDELVKVFRRTRNPAEAARETAGALCQRGKHAEAAKVLMEALDEERKNGEGTLELAVCFTNLAKFHRAHHRPGDAVLNGRQALAIQRKIHGNDHPDVAWALHPLGWDLYMNYNSEEAEKVSREELAIWRKNFGDQHVHVAWALGDLAIFLRYSGKMADAEAAIREAVQIRKALPILSATDEKDLEASQKLLAQLLAEQGKPAEAH